MRIFDATLTTLERALDARLLRQNVLAGNVANANTPGFVPRDLDFAAAMRESAAPAEEAPPVPAKDLTLASAGLPIAAPAEPSGARAPAVVARGADLPLGEPGAPHLARLPPLTAENGTGAGLDGNAVDLDRALAAVAENALLYGAAARAAQKKLAILRYAASDGTA